MTFAFGLHFEREELQQIVPKVQSIVLFVFLLYLVAEGFELDIFLRYLLQYIHHHC